MNLFEMIFLIFVTQISSFFMFIAEIKMLNKSKEENEISPIQGIKKNINRTINEKHKKEDIERINTILQNIDSYDGTDKNQKEVK